MTRETIEIESKDADRVHILVGTIVSTGDGVAEVNVDDYGTYSDIPVFYHCPESEIADGRPFAIDDRVIIVNSGDVITLSVSDMKVVGFEDGLPRYCGYYVNVTINGVMPTSPLSVKVVDINDNKETASSSEENPGKAGPFTEVQNPVYVFTPPISPCEYWKEDPEGILYFSVRELPCIQYNAFHLSYGVTQYPTSIKVSSVSWIRSEPSQSDSDYNANFIMKCIKKDSGPTKAWTFEVCTIEPAIDRTITTTYTQKVSGTIPTGARGIGLGGGSDTCPTSYFGEVCKPGDCQPSPTWSVSPDGTCMAYNGWFKIGDYTLTETGVAILTNEHGENPTFSDNYICVDYFAQSLQIGCCDGAGGPDEVYEENVNIPQWQKFTYSMVDLPEDYI